MSKSDIDINKQLVLNFQSGDKQALNELVKLWHKPFCEKAYWLVKDADIAKDIAQDSWSVIINKIAALEKPESFASWALRIVCNKSIDWLNSQKRKRIQLERVKQEQEISIEVEDKSDNTQLKINLLKAYTLLPKQQQTVIKLFYSQDYSLKEISETLNISVGTAKSRLFHAREKLKQILKT